MKFDKKMMMRFLLVAMGIFLFLGCGREEQTGLQGPPVIPVRAEPVVLQDLERDLEYVGSIKAQDEVLVYPKVSGKIIEKVKEEGAAVQKGQTLAYIDRDEVGLKFEKAPGESPLSGVVGRMYVDIGSHVLPQTPIALVVSMDKVKINLDIPEIYLPRIYLGQKATIVVDAFMQEEFIGTVTKISPVVNLENRAAPIEITIDNSGYRLKSGMFAKVSLAIEKRQGVAVVIKEAILGKEPDTYVYTVKNNKATMRKITLGIHAGPLYEVKEGLEEGELVVVMGQQRLYNDAAVSVEIGNNKKDRD